MATAIPTACLASSATPRQGLSHAGAPPDATAGGARALPAAQDVSAAPGAPDLSLPAARSADHAAEPRVGVVA